MAAAERRLVLDGCGLALAADSGPFGQGVGFSFLDLLEFGVDGEAGFDFKVQGSLVLKIDGDGVIVGCGVEVDLLDGLAVDLGKLDETSARQFAFYEGEATGRGASVPGRSFPGSGFA